MAIYLRYYSSKNIYGRSSSHKKTMAILRAILSLTRYGHSFRLRRMIPDYWVRMMTLKVKTTSARVCRE